MCEEKGDCQFMGVACYRPDLLSSEASAICGRRHPRTRDAHLVGGSAIANARTILVCICTMAQTVLKIPIAYNWIIAANMALRWAKGLFYSLISKSLSF